MPLVVASTPIGNLADASARLRETLAAADVIAAEDTRRLRRLLAGLGVEAPGRVVSCHEHNEAQRIPGLLDDLRAGRLVVLVTDAGTPVVSDPGHRLIAAAAAAGEIVTTVPGPSAATAALAVSGLGTDRWCFEGFPPRRSGERRRALTALAGEPRTMVFFEAPHRLAATLADMVTAFGAERPAVICRELTKTYEEVRRGTLGEHATWAADHDVRGEIAVVVAGASAAPAELSDEELRRAVQEEIAGGMTRRDAAATVAARHAVPRRRVYDLTHGIGSELTHQEE